MSSYSIIKNIHIATALLSITGFFIRGIWMMQFSPRLNHRWIKNIAHINDILLLVSAIALVFITAQYPGPAFWVNIKIIALVLYIFLGTIALKRGKTMRIRVIAWCLALLTFVYMFYVAFNKSVLPV